MHVLKKGENLCLLCLPNYYKSFDKPEEINYTNDYMSNA